jgi:hypothetical protein
MHEKNLADLYNLPPIPWAKVKSVLERDQPPDVRCFIATTRPDGRPHMAGVGAVWHDDAVWFVSGPGTRKSRNLAENANCAVSMALPTMDVVFEGTARRVTDDPTLQRLARRYGETGWPATVQDKAFTYDYSAPSAGPPPWYLYELRPVTAFCVLSEEPGGAMRWRFDV